MRMTLAIAFAGFVLLTLAATPGQSATPGVKRSFVWGPPGCVRVRSFRSRQTRYAGAPRCRRIFV